MPNSIPCPSRPNPESDLEARARHRQLLTVLPGTPGLEGVGVNAVARRAGVDKVLIYRYFGGLPGLVKAHAEEEFWPTLEELFHSPREEVAALPDREIAVRLLVGHLRELTNRPITQGIMRQELLERNELTDALAGAREDTTWELLALFSEEIRNDQDSDLAAVGALLHAGISYLVLRANTADTYMGVELGSAGGRERLERAIRTLVSAYFAPREGTQP